QFLAASVDALVAAYPAEPVPWMVLRFNPLAGMLSVAPAPEPSWVEGGERVELSLSSSFWEMEAERTYNESSDGSYEPLYVRVWGMVQKSLQEGECSRKLAAARALHPLRIVGFNSPSGCGDERVEGLTGPRAAPGRGGNN